jgi:hypothetical protein
MLDVLEMESKMKIILLIMAGISLLDADFTKTGDTVKTSVSKLEFQDDAIGQKMKWQEAINYCELLALDNHDDWRLPNVNELRSIVNKSKRSPSAVSAFMYTSSDKYWSSTSYTRYKNNAWDVNFKYASVFYSTKDINHYVRCVRDIQ